MDSEHILSINKSYGFTSQGHTQTRDGIIFSSDNNIYILRPLNENETKKQFTYAIQKHLLLNKFPNLHRIIPTCDNKIAIQLNEKKYYCETFHKGFLCNIENLDDVKTSIKILAKMHIASEGFTPQKAISLVENMEENIDFINYIKYDLGSLEILLNHRAEELLRFKKTAFKNKGLFDYEYISVADYYYNIAIDTCHILNESGYSSLCDEYATKGAICHKDFTSHNVIFCENTQYIANFNNASIDLPVFDLYNIIKQRMKKCGWNSSEAHFLINEYDKIKHVSEKEINIIKILFSFPQKLWRVVNKYYNSRKAWCEKSCLLKLDETKKERKIIETFIKEL